MPAKERAVVAKKAATKVTTGKKAVTKRTTPQKAERPARPTAKASPKDALVASKKGRASRGAPAKRPKAPVAETFERLRTAYPDAHCELVHRSAFELLVATVLSAQSTDVGVNKATPGLFARWPDAKSLAGADVADVERAIATLGMFRQKAKRIVELSRLLVEHHGGEVPARLDDLVKLPGVGRKTANVVLGVWFGKPEGVVVDTHVQRISQRLGWTKHDQPEEIEQDLMKVVPREHWDAVAHVLIFHGRRTCIAQRPACDRCPVNDACPSAFRAENVGRKPPRTRG
jgi:endonuclease-3